MKKILLVVLLCGFIGQSGFAKVSLPALFGDHMMLQQKAPVKIWGKADPGEKISISIGKQNLEHLRLNVSMSHFHIHISKNKGTFDYISKGYITIICFEYDKYI